eukprot:TRINITY_DN288_c0_g1::TRINITY_DN288_c0_g1_i1::g.1571::m.1571 TRINITY_DN288_c0_g1::TRINITY_DN288_c0_g1_i1::g.1571  ORF type:complete len:283 (+),score=118.09,sp/Q3ZBG9/PLS2_BOVIN/27.99/6e-19,Scramblase/PF03803.10/2.5e-29 TRINITY_DN288_c0_g1_i1:58-849(+)
MAAPQQAQMVPQMQAAPLDFWGALDNTDGLFIKQKVQWLEEIVGGLCEKRNKYRVVMKPSTVGSIEQLSNDQFSNLPFFMAKEESEMIQRICCGPYREFNITLKAGDQPMLKFFRPFKCTILLGCFLLYPQEIQVTIPNGPALGSVVQNFKCCSCNYLFDVKDAQGSKLYEIRGYMMQCGPNMCCKKFYFELYNTNDQLVGTIENVFPGCNLRGLCSKADNLQVLLNQKIPKEHKALLLGAVFLIDFMFFEKNEKEENNAAVL